MQTDHATFLSLVSQSGQCQPASSSHEPPLLRPDANCSPPGKCDPDEATY